MGEEDHPAPSQTVPAPPATIFDPDHLISKALLNHLATATSLQDLVIYSHLTLRIHFLSSEVFLILVLRVATLFPIIFTRVYLVLIAKQLGPLIVLYDSVIHVISLFSLKFFF
jgi:hypothetical protein